MHLSFPSALMGVVLTSVVAAVEPNVGTAAAWSRLAARSASVLEAANDAGLAGIRARNDVLTFQEFFGPVGDRGLDYSDRLRGLHGQVVSVTGYMVRDPERPRGVFILAASPVRLEQSSVCTQTDLPAATVYVRMPQGDEIIPYRPGRITLTGRLEVGPAAEADGRNSVVRLRLDSAGGDGLLASGS